MRKPTKNNPPLPTKPLWPMRLNKYLAHKNYATRRGADELISAGKVYLNGKKAGLGDKVNEEDIVALKDHEPKEYAYYAYYKPAGVLSMGHEDGVKSIDESAKFPEKVFPLGRLDKDSEGLLIMTNDGRMTDKLLNPAFNHEKEYEVTVDREISHEFLMKISQKVDIGIGKTKASKVRRTSNNTFEIILEEGKNRQIRRMCGVLGYGVKKLRRFRIMNILLGKLRPNQFRIIKDKELSTLKKDIGL